MLNRRPVGVAVQRLLAGGVPQECEQLRCLTTASQLLQQSLATWCAQATQDSQAANAQGDGAANARCSALHASSEIQLPQKAGYHTTSAAAAGTRQSITAALTKQQQEQQLQQQIKALEQQGTQQKAAQTPAQQQTASAPRQGQQSKQSRQPTIRFRTHQPAPHQQQQQQQQRQQQQKLPPTSKLHNTRQQQALLARINTMEKQHVKQAGVQAADSNEITAAAEAEAVAAVAVADADVMPGHSGDAKVIKQQQQVVTWDSSLLPVLISSLLASGRPSRGSSSRGSSSRGSDSSGYPLFSPEAQEFLQAVMQWWDDDQSTAAAVDNTDNNGLQAFQDEAWFDILAWLGDGEGSSSAPTAVAEDQQQQHQALLNVLDALSALHSMQDNSRAATSTAAGAEIYNNSDFDVMVSGDDMSDVDDSRLEHQGLRIEQEQQEESQHCQQQQAQHWQQEVDPHAEQQQLQQQTEHHSCQEAVGQLSSDAYAWEYSDTALHPQSQHQQQVQECGSDQSKPYMLAAVAAGLHWPLYINNVLLAIQYGTVQLAGPPEIAPAMSLVSTGSGSSVGSSSSSSAGSNDGSSRNSSSRGGGNTGSSSAASLTMDQQAPFAWMYGSSDSSSSSSTSSGDGDGLQSVLDSIRDPWRFEVPDTSSSSSSSGEPHMSFHIDGSSTGMDVHQQLHEQQQQQQQSPAGNPPEPPGSRLSGMVVEFLAGFLGVDTKQPPAQPQQQQLQHDAVETRTAPLVTSPPTLHVSTDVPLGMAPGVTPGPNHAVTPGPTQSRQVSPKVPPDFELSPLGHPRCSEAELVMLQKVTNMARGTPLEAALWCEMSNQPTLVTPAGLVVPGVKRIRLSRSNNAAWQQQQQAAQRQQQHQVPVPTAAAEQQQQQAKIRSYFAELGRKKEAPGLDWFIPLAAAAFAVAKAAGHPFNRAASRPGGMAQAIAQTLDTQQQQQQQQGVVPSAAAQLHHSSTADPVCSMLRREIRSSTSSSRLTSVWQQYPHYWPKYPTAVAAVLQQATRVWAAPVAASSRQHQQQTMHILPQLIADTWGKSEQLSLVEAETAAAEPAEAAEVTGSDADADAVAAAVAAAARRPSEHSAAAELFTSLVQWFTGRGAAQQTPPPVDLLTPPGLQKPSSSSSSSRSSQGTIHVLPASAESGQAVRQLVQLLTAAVYSNSSTPLQPVQDSLPIPQLTDAVMTGVSHLDPGELLDLYFTLMQWDKLSSWGEQHRQCAAQLYTAVVKELAKQQYKQLHSKELQRLLYIAEHACAASSSRAARLFPYWQEAEAAAPAEMRAAVHDAAAAGHLQQIIGMVTPLLMEHVKQQQQQQQQGLRAVLGLERLAPRLCRLLRAAAISSNRKTSHAFDSVAKSITMYLTTPQQQHDSAEAAAGQLQVPLSHLQASEICLAVDALQQMRLQDELELFAITICRTEVTSSSQASSTAVPLLHRFTAGQMYELLRLKVLKKPRDLDLVAAAAANRVQAVTSHLSHGLSSSSSSLASGVTVPAISNVETEILDLSQIMLFYYQLDVYHPLLLESLGVLLVTCQRSRINKTFTPASLTRIACALAKFNHCSRPAALAVQQITSVQLPNCSVPSVARLAWALAVLDQREGTLWRNIQRTIAHTSAREIERKLGGSNKTTAEPEVADIWGGGVLGMLHQASLFVHYHVPGLGALLSPDMAALAKRSWEQTTVEVTVSQMQRDISHLISALQAQPHARVERYELESRTELSSSSDILVRVDDQQVVVEVDGPTHYAKNDKYWRLGSSELRDLMLAAAGYRVLPMPYFVWDKLKNINEADRLRELNNMLHQVAKDGTILWQTAEWCQRYNLPHAQLISSCRPGM